MVRPAFTTAGLYGETRDSLIRRFTFCDSGLLWAGLRMIPGLYATGIISSGDYFGDYYPGREALSLCAHGGYIAGTNAAEAVK